MKVSVHYDRTRDRWMVSYLLPTGTAGKYDRKRRFFHSETAANEEAVNVRRTYRTHGSNGLAIDAGQWHRYQQLEERLSVLGATLETAVEHYVRNPPKPASEYLEKVVALFLEAKEPVVSRRWHRQLVTRMLRFTRQHSAARIGDITDKNVEAFMQLWDGAEMRANLRRMLFEFFHWSVIHGHVSVNPVERVPVPAIIRDHVPIMPVAHAGALLSHCRAHAPELLPFLALRMFAGLRTTSAERIVWEEIVIGESLELPAVKTKTRRRLYLTSFPPVLWRWLQVATVRTGRVAMSHYNAEVTAICRDLNIPFPKNVLRHSFATYHLAAYRNISETALLLGHRSSPRVLFEHYNGRATKPDGKAWFALTPQMVLTTFPPRQEHEAQ